MRILLTLAIAPVLIVSGGQHAWSADAPAAAVDVSQLIDDASSADAEKALAAIDELGEYGPAADAAVGALIQALGSDNLEIRWHAARTLASIGAASADAVPALTESLSDDAPSVRAYAAYALGQIGEPAELAVDQLIVNVFDKEELVRRASLRALHAIDPPVEKTMPLVMSILDKGDMSVIMPAMHSLAERGKEAVPRLRIAMKFDKAAYWACLVLADIGPDAAAAVPELTDLLQHQDPDVRLQALIALGEIGAGAESATAEIATALTTDDFPHVRVAAAYALGKLKPTGAARQALQSSLDSDDEMLRTMSAWALARTNPDADQLVKRAVGMIVNALKSDDVNVRQAAARAAVEFDIDPKIAGPALVEALQDEDPGVVANAIAALASMGPKVLDHVDDALQDEELRHYAVQLIARMGPEAQSAVPALIGVLQQHQQTEDDPAFVREAQFALARIGPGARKAVPQLVKSLASEDEQICASASYALGKIGPDARAAVPALRQAMQSDSSLVKLASVRALLEIQPTERRLAVVAVPLLMKALDADHEMIRAEAATALGELGNLGRPAISRLRELQGDENEYVREAATEALEKLSG